MLESSRSGATPLLGLLLGVGVLIVARLVAGPGFERAWLVTAGVSPFAELRATERVDQVFDASPLERSLALEARWAPRDPDRARELGDDLAREVAIWMLTWTGAGDLDKAERSLWATGRIEELPVRWATAVRERGLMSHAGGADLGLLTDGGSVAHADEILLLLAHVAFLLDLRADLVRSPRHHYVVLREPGGAGALGVEASCFHCVDVRGLPTPSARQAYGRRLVFPPERYPEGGGGIPAPNPAPPGTWQVVVPEELDGDLLTRLVLRRGGDADAILAEASGPLPVQVRFARRLEAGFAAWWAQDVPGVRVAVEAIAALRAASPDLLPPRLDEQVLEAALRPQGAARQALLAPVFAFHEPRPPVEKVGSEAHAVAMWLDVTDRPVGVDDFNARVVPLMNFHRRDPEVRARLCRIAAAALVNADKTLFEVAPECFAENGRPVEGSGGRGETR